MAATGKVDISLAYSKCMEFCQALATQGKTFHFSLNMGTTFSFSLDTRSKALALPLAGSWTCAKKEGKPLNTQRRNARRRMEFLNKKRQAPSTVDSSVAAGSLFSCEHCKYTNSSERGLRQHQRMKHGKPQLVTQVQSSSPPTPESLRQPSGCSYASISNQRGPRWGNYQGWYWLSGMWRSIWKWRQPWNAHGWTSPTHHCVLQLQRCFWWPRSTCTSLSLSIMFSTMARATCFIVLCIPTTS